MSELWEHRHRNIVSVTGLDWWLYTFLPTRVAAAYFSRELFDNGRTSFTLPNGSSWKILKRGSVESTRKPEGL